MRTLRVVTLALCWFLVVPVEAARIGPDAESLETATSHDVDEVRHLLRLADRLLHRIDSSWLERAPSKRLRGRVGLRIEEHRKLLHRLQDDLSQTNEEALGAPGATRLFDDFSELRRSARDLVQDLEDLTRESRRALERELIFESELRDLRLRLQQARWRALTRPGGSPWLSASGGERSSVTERAATLRRFNRLRQELDRIDGLRDPERRLASMGRVRSLRKELETLDASRGWTSGPSGPRIPPMPAERFVAPGVSVASGTGSITGTVTDDGTGTELENIHLELFDASGGWLDATSTNAAGVYQFSGLGTGDYYIKTWPDNAPYVDEVWPNVYCPAFCDPLSGDPISVTDGAVTSAIDLALALGGLISGRVTDSSDGSGIGMWLEIYDPSGDYVAFAGADPDGYYTSAQGLPPGNYFVWAKTIGGEHISEVYDNIVCHFWTRCGPADIVAGTAVPVTAGATTSGIDLALDPAGVLVGVITDQITTDPIADAGVDIWDSAGERIAWSWWSDPSGEYMAEWPLPAGTYYLTTWNHSGHLDELHSGFGCILGDCVPTDGTPVPMTAGVVTQIDFALTPGASFSGTVRDEADGTPIADGLVSVWDSGGDWLGDAFLNPDGTYFFGGMTSGTYYAITVTWTAHLDELYDDLPCWAGCDPLGGTAIVLTAGVETTGIDFDLALGGSFSGTVRAAADSSPIADGRVSVFDSSGDWLGDAWLDFDGTYSFEGIAAGSYYARTHNWAGYLDELYDDLPCWIGCEETTGDPIVVSGGADLPGIDFYLETGGSISGKVSVAGSGDPISNGSVTLYDEKGWVYDWAWLEPDGTYLIEGIFPGTYFATTSNEEGYLDELYDDILCASGSCDPTSGTGIIVPPGTEIPNVDFVLDLGGWIEGTVRDASDLSALPDVEVRVYDRRGWEVARGTSDGAGHYAAGGLVTGDYYAVTTNSQGYVNEIYNDVACVLDWPPDDCLRGGTALGVTVGSATGGIDFDLDPGGTISGTVTEDGSGVPLEDIAVFLYDETGRQVFYYPNYSDSAGGYSLSGLPTGDYYALTYGGGGAHLGELYGNLPAPYGWVEGMLYLGTPISVTAPLETTGIDFALVLGGSFSGQVTESSTGLPLEYAYVPIYDAAGVHLDSTFTDSDGLYATPGLPTGTYFARARKWRSHAQQLYDGLPCEPWCEELAGSPIAVTLGVDTGGVDFALDPLAGGGGSGSISGRVTEDGSGDPLADVEVVVYDEAGSWAGWAWTDTNGDYTATGLATGDYYARTGNSDGYLDELYDGFDCWDGCDETTGTAIPVTDGLETTGIDFALLEGGGLSGAVTDPAGAPLVGTYIDVFDASGSWVKSDRTDVAGGYEVKGLPAGTYHAATDFSPWPQISYLDELWNNLPCSFGSCDPITGDGIPVTLGNITPGIDFELAPGGSIAGRVIDVASGLPIAWARVNAYDPGGDYLRRTWTDVTGYYSLGGLPTGSYVATTVNGLGYLDELYNDMPCPLGNCDVTTGSPIAVTAGSTTSGKNFGLARGGTILGVVTDEGSTLPASAGVSIFDSSGLQVGSRTWTDAVGRYAAEGLPNGTYYAMASGPNHLAEAYDGVPCAAGCDVKTGTAIAISPGATLATGIDFSLDMGASVVGAVVDAVSGAPVTSGQVALHDSGGTWVASPWLDGVGRYHASGLLPATMCARTDNFAGFMDKRYDDLSCVGSCDPEKGTPFSVSLGARTSGVDFALFAPGADPAIVLQAERLDSGVTVSGCGRVTVGPDLGVTTTDPVRLVGKEIVLTDGFFTAAGVDLTFDADSALTCP